MSKSKVYFTDLRTTYRGDGLPTKLQKLMKKAGIDQIPFNDKFVAIKMHFGELGNISFLRPNYARAVVDVVKSLGGKPFLTDCNTMYPGKRKNALEHLECAWLNGFTPMTVGCPILIADGLKGLDVADVPINGGVHCKSAKIGKAIMDADVIISLTHFKGHESTGFGGALKNIGMGCGSRAGKCEQHSDGKPTINENDCHGCKSCQKECANGGLVFDETKKKMTVDYTKCVGCGRCIAACNFDAIQFTNFHANKILCEKIAEYTKAVVDGRPNFHISLIVDVSPFCDCHSENDAPIIPNIGMLCSFDPLALDKCSVDMCLKQKPFENTLLTDTIKEKGITCEHDHFKNTNPDSEWRALFTHAEKIGLGSTDYELIIM